MIMVKGKEGIQKEQVPGTHHSGLVRLHSHNPNPEEAVAEMYHALRKYNLAGILFFASPCYDRPRLAKAWQEFFPDVALGCTTSGEIASSGGYCENSIVAVAFLARHFSLASALISTDPGKQPVTDRKQLIPHDFGEPDFVVSMIDGLVNAEERIASLLQSMFHGIPCVGGSAGDHLEFKDSFVYHQGTFHRNAAVVAAFKTSFTARTFRIQHFIPTETKIVITEADPSRRKVFEIDGLPAAEAYAKITAVPREVLGPQHFARYPVMVRIGGEYFVRSIAKAHPDGSLDFFCAIDPGLVLTLGESGNFEENLRREWKKLRTEYGEPQLILAFDCILRKLEMLSSGCLEQVSELISDFPVVGFSTYGEQCSGLHFNCTLTGLILTKDDQG